MSQELNQINESVINGSMQVQDMINTIIGDNTKEIDDYIVKVKSLFFDDKEIPDRDLDHIILQIPTMIYHLTVVLQDIDVRKGVSAENAKFYENEQLLQATGTVAEKSAKAANASIKDRVVQLAYKSAASLIQAKMNAAMEIYGAAKKVQDRRKVEMQLTKVASNSVGAF